MATIDDLFRLMVEQKASDLHLTSGAPPFLRLHGNMSPLNYRQLSNQDVQALIFEILTEKQKAHEIFKIYIHTGILSHYSKRL